MLRRIHLFIVVTLLLGLAAVATWACLTTKWRTATSPASGRPDIDSEEAAMIAVSDVEPELLTYLESGFCDSDFCRTGSWAEWVIVAPDSVWNVEDLQMVHASLTTTIEALEHVGLDGRALLGGYRFRRSKGIYLPGQLGKVAIVQHDRQEILLADGALSKQWGFYIYHELGHVVDRRLEGALTHEFHLLASGGEGLRGGQTADSFWLDKFALDRPEEATADAFALWVILNYTTNPEPVFWMKPEEASYEKIAEVMDDALRQIAQVM